MNIRKKSSICRSSWLFLQILTIWITLLQQSADGRPQELMDKIKLGALQVVGQVSDMISNGGALRMDKGIEVPFAKVHSKHEVGVGQAVVHKEETPDSSEEDRRKRSIYDMANKDSLTLQSLLEMDFMLSEPIKQRSKRTPCWNMMGTSGGTGAGTGDGTGGTGGTGGADDVIEARKRAIRKRKAAQKKKSKSKKTTRRTKKKSLVDGDNQDAESQDTATAIRRKRQTEIDDLNAGSAMGGDFKAKAQQFGQKLKQTFDVLKNNMQQMASNLKNIFMPSGGGSSMMGSI